MSGPLEKHFVGAQSPKPEPAADLESQLWAARELLETNRIISAAEAKKIARRIQAHRSGARE